MKISHLNFFGRRRSIYIAVEDVIPWTDVNDDLASTFQEMPVLGHNDRVGKPYLYSLNRCYIYDKDLLVKILGVPL